MSTSKVIILTGASRGIGLSIAHFLLKQNHKIVGVARTAGPLEELNNQYPDQVAVLAVDLADFNVCLFSTFVSNLVYLGNFNIGHRPFMLIFVMTLPPKLFNNWSGLRMLQHNLNYLSFQDLLAF